MHAAGVSERQTEIHSTSAICLVGAFSISHKLAKFVFATKTYIYFVYVYSRTVSWFHRLTIVRRLCSRSRLVFITWARRKDNVCTQRVGAEPPRDILTATRSWASIFESTWSLWSSLGVTRASSDIWKWKACSDLPITGTHMKSSWRGIGHRWNSFRQCLRRAKSRYASQFNDIQYIVLSRMWVKYSFSNIPRSVGWTTRHVHKWSVKACAKQDAVLHNATDLHRHRGSLIPSAF